MRLEGVTYDINWKNFNKGSSFFLPCVDTRSGKMYVRNFLANRKLSTVTKVVVEKGIKGLRIWRL